MGRYYKETTIKKLFALSGNKCAFTDCHRKIIEENGEVFGEICHIEAASPKGPRYNDQQTNEERNGFENLVLLCPNHHKDTDDLTVFTVPRLKEMKKDHESKYVQNQFQVSSEQLQKIMLDIEDKLDRILEHVSKIPVLEQNSTTIINQNNEILKSIVEKKIENEFDLQSQSLDSVVAKIAMLGKVLNSENSDYYVNVNLIKNKSSIEITHKNFEKIDKKGMIFNVRLRLKDGKSQSLEELLKENKGNKIEFNAEEMEEFSFTKEGRPMYVVKNPHDSKLTISKSEPKPVLVKLMIPGKNVEPNYLLMEGNKDVSGKITLSNLKQVDSPLLVDLEIYPENKGSMNLMVRETHRNVAEAYEYNKLMNAILDSGQVSFIDVRKDVEFAKLKLVPDFPRTPDHSMELLRKAMEIQRITGVVLPWPPEQISHEEAIRILDAYDIITKGEVNGAMNMEMKFQKGELATKKMVESIKKYGYVNKVMAKIIESFATSIFGTVIQLGKYSITGKLVPDESPHEFLKRLDNYGNDEFIYAKMVSLEGKAKIKFEDWPKNNYKSLFV